MKTIKNLKNVVFIFALSLLLIGNTAQASFPVKQNYPLNGKIEQKTLKAKKGTSDVKETKIEKLHKNKIGSGGGSDKNLIIMILLWFFLGGLAGHRWYAGKPIGWNILFILTGGGFLVWWIIDGIRILSDSF